MEPFFSFIQAQLAPGNYRVEVLRRPPIGYEYYYLAMYECSDYSNVSLSGPDAICSSNSSFNIINLPGGASVQWITSNNISMISPQGSTTGVFKSTSSGSTGFITARITQTCGAFFDVTKNLAYVGLPLTNVNTSDDRCGTYSYHTATAQQITGTTSSDYKWYEEVGGTPTVLIANGIQLYRWPVPPSSARFYQLQVSTLCGTALYRGYAYNTNSGYSSMIFPNPVQDELTINFETTIKLTQNTHTESIETDHLETQIILYNNSQEPVFSTSSRKSPIVISLSEFTCDNRWTH